MKLGIQIGVLAKEWQDQGETGERQSCDAAVSLAKSMDLSGLEVFERHIMAYYDNPDYLNDLLAKTGISLSGVYFPMNEALKSSEETLRAAERACGFMKKVDGDFLVLNGGPRNEANDVFAANNISDLARTVNTLGKVAASYGISNVIHPHFGFMIETNDNLESLLDAGLDTDSVGLCVHASHQVLAGSDPYAMYERHGELVRYVHVGNGTSVGGRHIGSLLGEGDLDQRRLMEPLLDCGFDGWIIVECSKDGTSMKDYVEDSRKYLAKSFPSISWDV